MHEQVLNQESCPVRALANAMDGAYKAGQDVAQAIERLNESANLLVGARKERQSPGHVNENDKGDILRTYQQNVALRHKQEHEADIAFFEALKNANARLVVFVALKDALKQLAAQSRDLPTSPRLDAALSLADTMAQRLDGSVKTLEALIAQKQTLVITIKRKPAPPKRKFQGNLDACSVAMERLIVIHEKALQSMEEATRAVDAVDELSTKKFVEPQKPTSEEITRYLGELKLWAQDSLPASRDAAKCVTNARQYHATAERDLKLAQLAFDRVAGLEAMEVDHDVRAFLVANRAILSRITLSTRNWRFICNRWAQRVFDKTAPVTETRDDEQEAIDNLERTLRNIGVVVATKRNAKVKYDSISKNRRFELPQYELRAFNSSQVEAVIASMEEQIEKEEAVALENQRKNDEVDAAWDAYQARIAKAGELTKSAEKLARRIERALRTPRSDELTFVLMMVDKLRQLHGGLFSYMYTQYTPPISVEQY
jgi:hypothetical protein